MTKVLPSASDLLVPIIKVLKELGGVADVKAIEKGVISMLNLDSDLTSQVRIGKRTELGYRLSWARTRGKNLGYLEKQGNGKWALTKEALSSSHFS